MKLTDIKPGMVVAIGSMASVNGRYGGWAGMEKATIVVIGRFAERHYAWQGERFYVDGRGPRRVLVGKEQRHIESGNIIPDVVSANMVLMPWDEYLKKVDAEKKHKGIAEKKFEKMRKQKLRRFGFIYSRVRQLGVKGPLEMDRYGEIAEAEVGFSVLEKLLDIAEGKKS